MEPWLVQPCRITAWEPAWRFHSGAALLSFCTLLLDCTHSGRQHKKGMGCIQVLCVPQNHTMTTNVGSVICECTVKSMDETLEMMGITDSNITKMKQIDSWWGYLLTLLSSKTCWCLLVNPAKPIGLRQFQIRVPLLHEALHTHTHTNTGSHTHTTELNQRKQCSFKVFKDHTFIFYTRPVPTAACTTLG